MARSAGKADGGHPDGPRTSNDRDVEPAAAPARFIAPTAPRHGRRKLSVNVSTKIADRLRNLAFDQRLSESSIVEIALSMFFARGDDALLGVLLRQLGASLRRR